MPRVLACPLHRLLPADDIDSWQELPDNWRTYVDLLLRHATPKVAALQISAINNGAQLTLVDQYNI